MSQEISVENFSQITKNLMEEILKNPKSDIDKIAGKVVKKSLKNLGMKLTKDEIDILTFQATYIVVNESH